MTETLAQLKEQPHYSYSALNTFINICPLQFRYRYIDRLEAEQTPVALPFGTAFHSAMSEQVQAAKRGGLMSAQELTEAFAVYFKANVADSPNVLFKEGDTEDTLVELAERMLTVATAEWPDFHQTIDDVAVPFRLDIDGLSKPVIGECDLVVKVPTPFDDAEETTPVTVVDWKSAARMWPDGRADRELQASIYIAAYEAEHGQRPDFRYDVVTKTKTPKVGRFYTSRSDDQLDRMKRLVLEADRAIQAGVFLPSETGFSCGDCPFASACKAWHREQSRTVSVPSDKVA